MTERFDKDWDYLARQMGYRNEREMLEDLYATQGLSLKNIAARIGCGNHAVLHHLERYEIQRRARGGKNNPAYQARKLFRLDQRTVLRADPNQLAQAAQVSTSLVYKYRRAMREATSWISVYSDPPTNSSNMHP